MLKVKKCLTWLTTSSINFESCAIKITKAVGTPLSIILHTIFFVGIFALKIVGIKYDTIMLVLTTIVSLEAIYLAIFIQMTVNRSELKLEAVNENIEDMQEDIEELVDEELN